MLARVDGKSPVEYLSESHRGTIRRVSVPMIAAPKSRLADMILSLKHEFAGT